MRLALAAAAVALFGALAAAAQAPQLPPTNPLFPYGGESFRVDTASGALSPLESQKSKKTGGSSSYCHIEGEESPVVFRPNEPLTFASLVHGSPRDLDTYKKLALIAPVMKLIKLEMLFVSNEKRRYATGKFVPMEGTALGEPIPNINPKRAKDLGQLYASRPSTPLAPGEYAITVGGMFVAGSCGGPVSAFRIAR